MSYRNVVDNFGAYPGSRVRAQPLLCFFTEDAQPSAPVLCLGWLYWLSVNYYECDPR